MKKQILFSLFAAFFVVCAYSQTLSVDGTVYAVDTLENHQVGPGTHYTSLRLTGPNRLDVYFLKVDINNPNITFKVAIGRDSIYGGETPSATAKRKSKEGEYYFAGTNGSFFNITDYIGYPSAGCIVENEIARPPVTSRTVVAFDENKIPYIGTNSFAGSMTIDDGTTWTINTVNHLREENRLVLYNQLNGNYTHTNQYGTEVRIELIDDYSWGVNKTIKAKVTDIVQGVGNMLIPRGQAVLSGHGTAAVNLNKLSVDDVIDINLNITYDGSANHSFTQMIGGDNYPAMLIDGVIEQTWDERHPRTSFGYNQNKDTAIFCLVDGRAASAGVTTKQLAYIIQSAGAYTAYNMDGGGSSAMYIAEYGGPVNATSDGPERAVGNSLFVVATSPTDNNIGIIMPHKKSISVPRYAEYTPQFRGYNRYEVLLESDVQDVVLSCPPSLGTINGNKFIANGTENGVITATYNGNVTATINVNFIPASGIQIRLDSVIVDNRTGYPIEVVASTAEGNLPIAPQALLWTVEDSDICVVESGVLRALKSGTTTVYGELDGTRDTVKIKAEVPGSPVLIADDFSSDDNWTLTALAALRARLSKDNLPAAWENGVAVDIVLNAGRNPYIRLQNTNLSFYSLPDTIRLVANVGDMSVSGGSIAIKANNDSRDVVVNFGALEKNKDINIDVPVKDYLDTSDRGIYPIWFNYVNFTLGTDMTINQSYTLALKEVASVYEGVSSTGFSVIKGNTFNVYPNPITDNVIFIQLKNTSKQPVKAELYNLSGQMLCTENFGTPTEDLVSFSTGNIAKGTYFLKIYQGQESETTKLVK